MSDMNAIWHVDMEIASTLQRPDRDSMQSNPASCPIIHFGLIKLNYSRDMVRGGFSKVYFGLYKNQKVAVKMLFVMELTAQTIKDFYREADVLVQLSGELVVECKGVTIMPPAIAVVMEYCPLGSLYSFLYENSASKGLEFSPDGRTYSTDSVREPQQLSFSSSAGPDFGSMDLSTKHSMMLDASAALAFVHRKGYMHCDMKSLNYLVTDVSLSSKKYRTIEIVMFVICRNCG
jgi:serine/threonine protein kinase